MSKVIRILALGDSLTAGYYNGGCQFHPYSIQLTNLFSSIGISVHIDEKGFSGEQVVPSMVRRLEKIFTHPDSSPYDWIIILGGTNDLGWRRSAEQIYDEGLKLMYDRVLQTTSHLVIMTVIENAYDAPDTQEDQRRQRLNDLIRKYAETHPEKYRIHLVDLANEIRCHHLTDPQQRSLFWDDDVHLTPAGYDQIANIIFHIIKDKFNPS